MNRAIGVLPNGFAVYPIYGAEGGGYSTEADALNIGRLSAEQQANLQAIFEEFQATMTIYNAQRSSLVSLISYPVAVAAEMVAQIPGGGSRFEEASEFGVPQSINAALAEYWFGYTYRDLDLATRFTWKFLRDADQRQIEAVHE